MSLPPSGLLCQLLESPEKTLLFSALPKLGWIVNSSRPDSIQTAYQIIAGPNAESLHSKEGLIWDSEKTTSTQSSNIPYAGDPLKSHSEFHWQVRTWDKQDTASPWSPIQKVRIGDLSLSNPTETYPLEKSEFTPTQIVQKGDGHTFIAFEKAVFGTIRLQLDSTEDHHSVEIHLGEALSAPCTLNRNPDGHIRYRKISLSLKKGTHAYTIEIPPDERNTGDMAILIPKEIGEVMPFRYCEIINTPEPIDSSTIKQIMVHYPFDDSSSHFESSNKVLNQVWDLCKYTIKATSFCGTYVDGDRERIPYEGDAYINQLCHYCVDREYTMARHSHEFLMHTPTWPTDWILHSVLMAWADYEYTGNTDSLEKCYDDLKAKTLSSLARNDGLISSETGLVTNEVMQSIHLNRHALKDLVDWPSTNFEENVIGERDSYEMVTINTVVNALHFQNLRLMTLIASVLHNTADTDHFHQKAERVRSSINTKLFDQDKGLYTDGETSSHASLHANMFPLAFGLVPIEHQKSVITFIKSRGMACSVYGAQYLLEALYLSNEDHFALDLMTAQHDRGWWNMLKSGSTMALEAWDWKYKNNLDWNHAWGAVPANIIPRFLMGIRPLEPGFSKILIQPRPGNLKHAKIKMPTIRGTVSVEFENDAAKEFILTVDIPANTTALIRLPRSNKTQTTVLLDGTEKKGIIENKSISLEVGSGQHTLRS
ncbi:MAG: alpha-L-rhamnosidase [Opitutaceae bacterium]|nr:alpha-L-rhamnosidase [Opitutaceae bacterium]